MTPDPKRLKEALDVACHNLALSFDAADENVEAYETLRAFLATFDEREAFVDAARAMSEYDELMYPNSGAEIALAAEPWRRDQWRAHRALVAAEQSSTEPRKGDGDDVVNSNLVGNDEVQSVQPERDPQMEGVCDVASLPADKPMSLAGELKELAGWLDEREPKMDRHDIAARLSSLAEKAERMEQMTCECFQQSKAFLDAAKSLCTSWINADVSEDDLGPFEVAMMHAYIRAMEGEKP